MYLTKGHVSTSPYGLQLRFIYKEKIKLKPNMSVHH